MPTKIGTHIQVPRADLADKANIEEAFQFFWMGSGTDKGVEDNLYELKINVDTLISKLGGTGGEVTGPLIINANEFKFSVPVTGGGLSYFQFRGPEIIGATHTYTYPTPLGGGDTIVLANTTQELSRKTLANPTITNTLSLSETTSIVTPIYEIKPVSKSGLVSGTETLIDQFSAGSYRSGEYIISASATTSPYSYYICKILVIQDGSSNLYITPYGEMATDSAIAVTFRGEISKIEDQITVKLYMTPTLTPGTSGGTARTVNVKGQAVLIKP